MDPIDHRNKQFTCRALISYYDLFNGWWYNSCPECNKALSRNPNAFRCTEHDPLPSAPIPWFKIECVVVDDQDVTSFSMVGKTTENFFGALARHYIIDTEFKNPSVVSPAMIAKLNKPYIFQLRFGAFRSSMSRCEIIVTNVFDDDASLSPLQLQLILY